MPTGPATPSRNARVARWWGQALNNLRGWVGWACCHCSSSGRRRRGYAVRLGEVGDRADDRLDARAGVQQPLGRLGRVERAELEGGGAQGLDVVVGHQPRGPGAVEPGGGGHRADRHGPRTGSRSGARARGGRAARPQPLGEPALAAPDRDGRGAHHLAGRPGGPGQLHVVEREAGQGAVPRDHGGRGVDQRPWCAAGSR